MSVDFILGGLKQVQNPIHENFVALNEGQMEENIPVFFSVFRVSRVTLNLQSNKLTLIKCNHFDID